MVLSTRTMVFLLKFLSFVSRYTQRQLFVAATFVHARAISFGGRSTSHRRMQAGRVDHHTEFLKVVGVAELVQGEGLVDRSLLAGGVHRAVDRLLGHLQRE